MTSSSSGPNQSKTSPDESKSAKNPWRKPFQHFKAERESIKGPSNTSHIIYRIFKKTKAGESDSRKKPWILVENNHAVFGKKNRLNDIIGAGTDIMRFLINNIQIPKTDILLSREKKDEWPISKEAIGSESFYDYYEREVYPQIFSENRSNLKVVFPEEMAAILYAKCYCLDDDMHGDNFRISKYLEGFLVKPYLIGIDFDWLFSPVTAFLHRSSLIGKLSEDKGQIKRRLSYRKRVLFPEEPHLAHENATTLPTVNAKDFDSFPLVTNHVPNIYDYNDSAFLPYSNAMKYDEVSVRSKFMVALKILIGDHMIKMIIKKRVEHPEDQAKILKIIDLQSTKQKTELTQSLVFSPLLNYFNEQFLTPDCSSMICFFFELSEFFKENRHYLPPNPAEQKQLFINCAQEMLKNYLELLPYYKLTPPSDAQQNKVIELAEKIYNNDVNAIQWVKVFYQTLQFNLRQIIVDQRIQKITKQLNSSSTTSSCTASPNPKPNTTGSPQANTPDAVSITIRPKL